MASPNVREPKYQEGNIVWLKASEDDKYPCPRQQAEIIGIQKPKPDPDYRMYVVQVEPEDGNDDGLREVCEIDIEGLVEADQ